MSHHLITHLRLSPHVDWDQIRGRLEDFVGEAAELETVAELRLLEIDARSGVLTAAFTGEEGRERFASAGLGALLDRLGLALAPPTLRGEAVFTFRRAEDDAAGTLESLDDAERLAHFVREVVESETVWGLYDETWARSTAAGEVEALPFWSQRELAARCIAGRWRSFAPRAIELTAFVDQWLTGMHEDGIVAVILPTPADPGAIVGPEEIAEAIRAALT